MWHQYRRPRSILSPTEDRVEMLASCACKRLRAIKYRQIATCRITDFQTSILSSTNLFGPSPPVSIYDTATASLNGGHSLMGLKVFQSSIINQILTINYICEMAIHRLITGSPILEQLTEETTTISSDAIWQSSTMKKRRMKMNKHKLKKRKKSLRMNTKISRS